MDDAVGVRRLDAANAGTPLAVAVHYACYPVVLAIAGIPVEPLCAVGMELRTLGFGT